MASTPKCKCKYEKRKEIKNNEDKEESKNMPISSDAPKDMIAVESPSSWKSPAIVTSRNFWKGSKTCHNTRWDFRRHSRITEVPIENDVDLRGGQAFNQHFSLNEGHRDLITDVTGRKHHRVVNGIVFFFFCMCHV